ALRFSVVAASFPTRSAISMRRPVILPHSGMVNRNVGGALIEVGAGGPLPAPAAADGSPDWMRRSYWVFANGPAQASSCPETGNNSDGLCRPCSVGIGRKHLHLRPVVRELAAAIEANHVCSGYGRCCNAAAQLAAHRDGKTAPLVPTTEDQIEQTHKPSSIDPTIHAASRIPTPFPKGNRFRLATGYMGFRIDGLKRGPDPSTNRLHQARTQPRR